MVIITLLLLWLLLLSLCCHFFTCLNLPASWHGMRNLNMENLTAKLNMCLRKPFVGQYQYPAYHWSTKRLPPRIKQTFSHRIYITHAQTTVGTSRPPKRSPFVCVLFNEGFASGFLSFVCAIAHDHSILSAWHSDRLSIASETISGDSRKPQGNEICLLF